MGRTRRTRFTFFVFCYLVFTVLTGHSQNLQVLSKEQASYRVDQHVEILIDESNALNIDDILRPANQRRFTSSNGKLTFGYLKPNLWLKLRTQISDSTNQWILELPAPFIEYVDFYQWNGEVWKRSQAGYYRPQSVRDIPHTSQILPLVFAENRESTVYIKISGTSPKTFPLYVYEKEAFYAKVRLEDIGYGLFFGILIVMFVYNLLLYLSLNHANYLLYISTIVCTILIFSSASGYGGRFLWPETPIMNYYAGRISLPFMTTMLSIFAIRFLEVRRMAPVMYYLLASLIPLSLLALILVASKVMPSAGNNLISISTILYMATGIVCAIKGNKTAYYFIAAWTIYLFGGLMLTLRNSGVLPFNFWTTHFVEIGAATETMIIAFALGDRYRRYKQEKEEVQALALKAQQEAREVLEQKVEQRTLQLSLANRELESMLEKNRVQTKVIEKKNEELDSFFYRISHDLKGPITSLQGLTSIARMDVQDQKALSYFEKQEQQVSRLKQIINGLINLTKLNHEELEKERIDFDKLITDCISSFNAFPNFKSITFRRNVDPKLEFHCEWVLINAVLQNLVENAIKYSRGENPYVHIRVFEAEEQLVLEVEDNGQGIPTEQQSKIFDMFYRASHSAAGTGLGLYILKRSVERLKGAIDIQSTEKIGSVFTIRLPLYDTERVAR